MELYANQQAEQAILGSIIMNNAVSLRIADFLEEKHFYFQEHKAVWRRLVEIGGKLANEITLQEFFANNTHLIEVGGLAYLPILLSEATGIVDIREYGQVIVELWQKRELNKILGQAGRTLHEESFNSISALIENELAGLSVQEPRKKVQHMSEMLEELENDKLSVKFVPTGFYGLDELLNGGIYSQQLVIIGARPSVGKTSVAQNIILNASKKGKKCLFISLEVDKRNVIFKFLSNLTSIPSSKIARNLLNQIELGDVQRAKQELKRLDIYTDDSSYLRISQIGKIIKNQLQKHPLDLIVVDYVQIIRGDDPKGKNEALIIKENTTMLKAFAKQYDVAVLALAQINRKAVEGANQEPTINDFKSSGGIEEDADVAIILHRDRDEDRKESYFSKSGKFIVAKNRHGRTGEIPIQFVGHAGRFNEIL